MPYVYDDGSGRDLGDLLGGNGFGSLESDWEKSIKAAAEKGNPGVGLLQLLNTEAVTPLDPATAAYTAWVRRLLTLSCADAARSIGRGSMTAEICTAFDNVLVDGASGSGWPAAQAMITEGLAAQDAIKWRRATCLDRADADGGGEVCTAADGSQQVRCWNSATGAWDNYSADHRCPGYGGSVAPGIAPVAKTVTATFSPSATSGLKGRVTDSSGAGVSGAQVRVRLASGFGASTTTDAAGNFVLTLSVGTYTLLITSPSGNASVSNVTVSAANTTDIGSILVKSGPAWSGGSLTPTGGPTSCPSGQLLDPVTGLCIEQKTGAVASRPWYKAWWFWVPVGTVVVVGGSYLAWRATRKEHA